MKMSHSPADTPAPKASHDASGWCRRGAYSNSRATEPSTKASPSGQRATRQTESIVSLQSTESRIAAPPISKISDKRANKPADDASSSALRYLERNGRSRSIP